MKRILIFIAVWLLATRLQAQVNIGSTEEPQPFSVLELFSNQQSGLRLPQLTTAQRDTLDGKQTEITGISAGMLASRIAFNTQRTGLAMGLQIYNTDSKCVETWNGQDWIMECGEHSSGRPYALGEVAYRISSVATAPITGRLRFATKNLGATISDIDPLLQIAAPEPFPDTDSSTDETIYGSLYQWGRYHDGHESRSSANYPTNDPSNENGAIAVVNVSDGQVPLSDAYGKFIKNDGSGGNDYYHDWSQTQNNLLWGGNDQTITIPHTKGIADPCPAGFRVPSQAEWAGIMAGVGLGGYDSPYLNTPTSPSSGIFLGVNKWQWVNSNTPGFLIYPPTVDSDLNITGYQTTPTLFLPAAGDRYSLDGQLHDAGQFGSYWSSTVETTGAYSSDFTSDYVQPAGYSSRAVGLSVRCLGGVITY